jgi:FlaG/FlaF family flagellin (archaellin)
LKLMTRRLLRDKRAITPVLSSLLLTVVAVAAMAIATSATYVITTNLKENMGERIIVEDVWFKDATQTVDIYMHNIGKVAIRVSSVYINHTSITLDTPLRLELNGHDWLNIAYSWSSGDLYYIDIVTNRGTHIASYYKAP